MYTRDVSKPLAIGVIGTGGMGARHARNVHRFVSGARVAAVYDLDEARACQVAAECGGAAVLADPAALIADERVDAVILASPDETHVALTLTCLRAGKPVLCEKPLATRAEAAGQVVVAEAALGRRLVSVGYMRRFDPQHVAVRALAHSGEIGQPLLFKGVHRNARVPVGTTGDTILINSATHDLDSARWLLGEEIQSVSVRGLRSRHELHPDTRDLLLIELRLTNERLGVAEVYVNADYGYEVSAEVVCQAGTAQTVLPGRALVRRRSNRGVPVASDWLAAFQEAYVAELHDWVDAVQMGRCFAGASAWDGYAGALAIDAGIQSLATGGAAVFVQTPPRPALYA